MRLPLEVERDGEGYLEFGGNPFRRDEARPRRERDVLLVLFGIRLWRLGSSPLQESTSTAR